MGYRLSQTIAGGAPFFSFREKPGHWHLPVGYPSSMPRERYRIADLTLDVDAVSLLRDGQSIPLPRLSFDLLVALARRAPRVLGTEELIETVWAGTAISDETLTQRVALLRRALGDDAKNPRYLRAVRSRGYQLVPEVVVLAEDEGAGGERLPSPGEVDRGGGRGAGGEGSRSRITVAAGIAAALAILGLGLVLFLVLGRRAPEAEAVATRSPAVPELLARAGGYLSLHQERNNELAVELYRRALRIEPDNPQTLAGLSLALSQRATKFNRHADASGQALELARQAIRLAPRLGIAHHALGLALDSQGRVSGALAAYRRAAELEAEPANALASAAHLLQVQGHLAEALETNLRAARAGGENPPYLEVQIGATLALLGFEPASAIWFERALELRPDNVFAAAAAARARLAQGRLRDADAIAARALGRGIRRPELPTIRGTVALLEGNEEQAGTWFREALAIAPDYPPATVRLLLLASRSTETGLEQRSRKLVDAARRGRAAGDEWPDSAIDEALLEAAFGHEDAALRALDTAIALGYRDVAWLLRDPGFASLRQTPGFSARIETLHRRVAAERQRVEGAAWLPPSLLSGNAARM
jgi:DNA-binding winged helix-turn-helix (wHTH) protein/Tfp pilus assembly protein PilF